MTTVINASTPAQTTDSSGWVVAMILVLAVAAGGAYLYVRSYRSAAPAPQAPASVQVNIPNPVENIGGNSGGGDGGAQQ